MCPGPCQPPEREAPAAAERPPNPPRPLPPRPAQLSSATVAASSAPMISSVPVILIPVRPSIARLVASLAALQELAEATRILLESRPVLFAHPRQRVQPVIDALRGIGRLAFLHGRNHLRARLVVLLQRALLDRGKLTQFDMLEHYVDHLLHAADLLAIAAGAREDMVLHRGVAFVDRDVELRIDEMLPIRGRADVEVLEPGE